MRLKEATEVARHRPEIGSDKNLILLRGEGQHFRVRNSFQPRFMGRKKINSWLTTETPRDDCIVETGIRQEADHSLASPRDGLLPHTLKRLFDFGRRWMRVGESILLTLAFRNIRFHIFATSKVEGDRAINLLEAQRGIM